MMPERDETPEQKLERLGKRMKAHKERRWKEMNTPREWPLKDNTVERWVRDGFDCALTTGFSGNLCGYVKLPPNHAFSGKHYDEIDVQVHGGLTFACRDLDGGWWIGFDTAHFEDRVVFERPIDLDKEISRYLPGAKKLIEGLGGKIPKGETRILPGKVWIRPEVVAEVEFLVTQLKGGT